MKTLWCKNQENPIDRISHAWAPLRGNDPPIICKKKNFLFLSSVLSSKDDFLTPFLLQIPPLKNETLYDMCEPGGIISVEIACSEPYMTHNYIGDRRQSPPG
jgi:hypothetical protein